jgi:hypothetical protein
MQFVNDLDEDQQLRDRLLEEIEMDRDGSRWPSILVSLASIPIQWAGSRMPDEGMAQPPNLPRISGAAPLKAPQRLGSDHDPTALPFELMRM